MQYSKGFQAYITLSLQPVHTQVIHIFAIFNVFMALSGTYNGIGHAYRYAVLRTPEKILRLFTFWNRPVTNPHKIVYNS
jgi:hypothetical protein